MDPGALRLLATRLVTGVTEPPPPRPARLRRGRFDLVEVADAVIAVIAFGLTNSTLASQNARHGSPQGAFDLVVLAFLICVPLVLRSRFPVTAWAASALAMIIFTLAIPPHSFSAAAYPVAGVLVYELCLYAVAVRCKFRMVVVAVGVTILGSALIDGRTSAVAVLLAVVPLLAGVIVRSRRRSIKQLEVAERRHEGERALLEERQRIARELHDVVAHHMSVIAIQAEAAPYRAADPPPELVESFAEIRASALSGLRELRRVLGVLRSGGPDTAPQPGLEGLDGLLESARSGGVTVAAEISGQPRPLAPGVDLSAYRILQEALSNAMRHAPGSAVRVRVAYRREDVMIEVRNDGYRPDGAGDGAGGGHGIVGMRERVAMLKGSLTAGPAAGGEFQVIAVLPALPPQDNPRPEGLR
jgi:signal transduction histidine kinase